jgi:hypothetical protein
MASVARPDAPLRFCPQAHDRVSRRPTPAFGGARDGRSARATADRHLPLTLRLVECAIGPWAIAGGCSAAKDGPRRDRSSDHDQPGQYQ